MPLGTSGSGALGPRGSSGRVARWADDLIGWIRILAESWQRAPGGFRRKLLSGTTGNRINVEGDSADPPAPDYIRLETIIGRNSISPSRGQDRIVALIGHSAGITANGTRLNL